MEITGRINTDRVYLQTLDSSSADNTYLEWMNDPDVTRFLESRFNPPKSLDELKAFIKGIRSSNHSLLLGIYLQSNGRHIGNIKLGPISKEHRRSSIGYLIGDKALWGKGFSTEAVSAAAQYAISELALVKLTAGVYESNEGSAKMLRKCGFIEEAYLPNHVKYEGNREGILLFAYYKGA